MISPVDPEIVSVPGPLHTVSNGEVLLMLNGLTSMLFSCPSLMLSVQQLAHL